jgi:glucose/arabinose dehydrogenase
LKRTSVLVLVLVVGLLMEGVAFGQSYALQNLFPGVIFTRPVALATPPGESNRLFVVEQLGRIKVIANLGSPSAGVFLDISSRVRSGQEEGLLGLAFHPGYASNGQLYVFYSATVGAARVQRVSRFKVSATSPNLADPASEQILLEQVDDFGNNQGGDLHFGPDGYLYVSLGDEGGGADPGNNSQTITRDFFSGILRIDVDSRAGNRAPNPHPAVRAGTYLVPADNPFVGATSFNGAPVNPAQVRTELWAVGLRNPWRFSFDPATGKLWCGDVGHNLREEISIIEKGKNYGWAFREGTVAGPRLPAPGAVLTAPVWDYGPTAGRAVIGGVVYRGSALPELAGAYVYGDFADGSVWALQGVPGAPTTKKLSAAANGISAFGRDPRNGELLVADVAGQTIRRLVAIGPYVKEAESLSRASTGAATAPQSDGNASGGTWIALQADGVGDFVDYTLPSVAAGSYTVKLKYKAHPNRGVLSLKVDGVQVGGTLDQYSATVQYPEVSFGPVTFGIPGDHVIRLTVTAKNAAAGAFTLSADRFTLAP